MLVLPRIFVASYSKCMIRVCGFGCMTILNEIWFVYTRVSDCTCFQPPDLNKLSHCEIYSFYYGKCKTLVCYQRVHVYSLKMCFTWDFQQICLGRLCAHVTETERDKRRWKNRPNNFSLWWGIARALTIDERNIGKTQDTLSKQEKSTRASSCLPTFMYVLVRMSTHCHDT